MSGLYSFRLYVPVEIVLQKQRLTLVEGMHTFNCHVEDIDVFTAYLHKEGARITQVVKLDSVP